MKKLSKEFSYAIEKIRKRIVETFLLKTVEWIQNGIAKEISQRIFRRKFRKNAEDIAKAISKDICNEIPRVIIEWISKGTTVKNSKGAAGGVSGEIKIVPEEF